MDRRETRFPTANGVLETLVSPLSLPFAAAGY